MDELIDIPQYGINLLFNGNEHNEVKLIKINLIDDFPNHPYPVKDDDALVELSNSISKNGQLEPAIVRALGNGRYQMLSGHRRKLAHMKLLNEEMRAIVLESITDSQAKAIMLDCNVRRDELLPSEKAKIYYEKKMLYKHMDKSELAELTDLFGGTKRSATAVVAKRSEESEGQIKRYIRFHSYASETLKSMVDAGHISLRIADELLSVSTDVQGCVCKVLSEYGCKISYVQATAIKNMECPSEQKIKDLFGVTSKYSVKKTTLCISAKKLRSYFPAEYSNEQIETIVFELLENWRQSQMH